MSALTSNSISGCTDFSTYFWGLKPLVEPSLVRPNTLLGSPMVLLPQVSLIWHHVFMFFLPPTSFTPPLPPKLLSLHFPILLHLFKFATSLFTPSLSPNCVPNPAFLSSFSLFCSFYGYPLATTTNTHYLISNYIVSHPTASG